MPILHSARWLGLALAALAAGCGSDDPFDPDTEGKLRITNASLAAGGDADFVLDGSGVTRLAYLRTSGYLTMDAGAHDIAMRDLPDENGVPGPTFISAPITVTAGRFQTVVITGSGTEITALTTIDEAAPGGGNWSLRIIHAGQAAPSLDLYVTTPDADLNAATPLVTGIDWKEVTAYQEIGIGRFQIRLTPTGTKTALISSAALTFAEGQVASLIVFDNTNPSGAPFGVILPDGDLE
ncbi:MAG TPA: DUF4397 domain-containing protein [Gemmatimonadales bacterium]|nr:DUF4397 domain-containing protein [Gemmatimonadales bacterium]